MKKRVLTIAIVLLALSANSNAQTIQQDDPIPMPVVNQDSLMKHIVELSSEVYAGRLAGSEGFNRAMNYAKGVLARYGATEIAEQPFEVECNEIENCKFNVYKPVDATKANNGGSGGNEKRVFSLGNEFCCAGMTGRGYVDAQMVFCGYGIDNGSFNEYKDVDAKGKIVIVLTGLPGSENGAGFLSQAATRNATLLRDKARTAESHGAIGMIVVNTSKSCLPSDPQARVYCGELPHLATFPILQVTYNCGRELFWGEAIELDSAIARIERAHRPQSFSLLKKAEIDVNARYRAHATTCNLTALLEGADPKLKKEYIVVGASIDGAGMQGETCIFPGADINASGVAALLETARVLSDSDYRPKRSILFVLFSASEQQYLGSRVFMDTYKKQRRIEAFLNIQNIGQGDSVVVLGDGRYPTLWNIAASHDTCCHNIYKGNSTPTNPRGDARIFDAIGIPSLVFTTHNGMRYNHVSTDMWENIDRRILTISAQILSETVAELGEGLYQGRSLKSRSLRNKQ